MRTTKNPKYTLPDEEITPKELYVSRRKFLKQAGAISAGALLAACIPAIESPDGSPTSTKVPNPDSLTPYESATGYINYYEFSTSKEGIDRLAKDFTSSPWQLEISGLVKEPLSFSIEDLLSKYKQEERIYRMRCVEGWSMVLPWIGFPLYKLLEEVELLPDAKYVGFETIFRPEEMPGQRSPVFPWPYLEGLRLDEAMNDLTLLATGMYDEPLLPQNGAPIRLVVPWKYGFKSIKSIVKITLLDKEPETMWKTISPTEYGFYANVNPDVDHPRWSQATERRIGEAGRRPTLHYNGYAEQVASMYKDLDPKLSY